MKVKICGLRGLPAARACVEAGADMVGLNFVAGRRRALSLDDAEALSKALAGEPIELVGVFVDPTPAEVDAIASRAAITWVQLHGAEPPSTCAELATRYRVIKAFSVGPTFDRDVLGPYEDHVAAFLLDGANAGSGERFDWSAATGVSSARPVFVAGGLHPGNVADAIAALRPDGVDTASGVEVDGRPDPTRIHAFCAAVRQCP